MVSKCFAKRAVLKKGGQRAFSEGKKEGIFGGQKRGHFRRASKEGKGGHKEGKTRNCNLPKNLLKKRAEKSYFK